jgi:hypothetical protein
VVADSEVLSNPAHRKAANLYLQAQKKRQPMFRQTTPLILTLILLSSFVLKTDNSKIQTDLKLTATHKQTGKQNGDGTLTLTLTNNSQTDLYKIISPGDGSESEWREPYIYYSADLKTESGVWEKLKYRNPSRCALYSPNWQDYITIIKPKQTIIISETMFRVKNYFTINSSGIMRLVVYYDYAQGRHSKVDGEEIKQEIADIPAFTLVSDTIEFKVVM